MYDESKDVGVGGRIPFVSDVQRKGSREWLWESLVGLRLGRDSWPSANNAFLAISRCLGAPLQNLSGLQ